VIRTGAHQRQAERDIDTLLHPQVFDRDQTLVVVHRHHHIKLARLPGFRPGPHKHRVWCERATHVQPLLAGPGDGRRNDVELFPAEQSAFASVRIEPGHRDTRQTARGTAHRLVGDPQGLQHTLEGHRLNRVAQRQMDTHQHGPEFVVGQHHAYGYS